MRRTLIWAAVVLLVILPLLALADTPVAKIKGPIKATPGSTIVLDARGSVSEKPLRWRVEPDDAVVLTLDQDDRKGVVALIPDAQPGTYRFVLVARGTPPGAAELDADATVHTVAVAAPEPAPVPPAPPGPDPLPAPPSPASGLPAELKAAVTGIAQPPAHKAQVIAALAAHYRAIGSAAGGGAYATPEALLAANRARLTVLMNTNAEPWRPVAATIKAYLDAELAAKRLTDAASFGPAFFKVAEALEVAAQ